MLRSYAQGYFGGSAETNGPLNAAELRSTIPRKYGVYETSVGGEGLRTYPTTFEVSLLVQQREGESSRGAPATPSENSSNSGYREKFPPYAKNRPEMFR